MSREMWQDRWSPACDGAHASGCTRPITSTDTLPGLRREGEALVLDQQWSVRHATPWCGAPRVKTKERALMRPVMVSGILVLVGVVGLGSLWPRPGRALAPRVLDSRAAERAMNHTLHDFQAVLQCRRHAGQARAPQAPIPARSASWCGPAAVPSPILSRPAWGQAPAQEEPQRGLETLPDSLELVSPRPKEETARGLEYGLA